MRAKSTKQRCPALCIVNFNPILEAQLFNEIILLSYFKLDFWISWVLKPLPSNFQQSPMTTDKEIKDSGKF